mgnify:CR=1 FL=1
MSLECLELLDFETAISRVQKGRFRVIGDLREELCFDSYFIVGGDGDYESFVEVRAVAGLRQDDNQRRFEEDADAVIDFYVINDQGKVIYSAIDGEIEQEEE